MISVTTCNGSPSVTLEIKPFLVTEGGHVRLSERPTQITPPYESKTDYRKRLRKRVKRISKLQQAL